MWGIGCLGFACTYVALLLLRTDPSLVVLCLVVVPQGFLGYGLTSVLGAIPAEIFEGRHYGAIFGTLALSLIVGGALGPWLTGALHDQTGSYALPFWIAIVLSALSAIAIWRAAPREVRVVAGRLRDRTALSKRG